MKLQTASLRSSGICRLPGFIVGILLAMSSASAQTTHTEQAATKLKTLVHMPSGSLTLGHAVSALSEQTGLTIEADTYLNDRRLIVRLKEMSAADVLNALATLNGYVWRETENEHILLTRLRPSTPRAISEVPAAVRAVIPFDFVRFFGVGVPDDELPPIEDKNFAKIYEKMNLKGMRDATYTRMRLNMKIQNLVHRQFELLYTAQTAKPLSAEGIPCAKLTQDQQRALKVGLTLSFAPTLIDHRIMFDMLAPFQRDPTLAEVSLYNGNGLMIGIRGQGFGAAIDGLVSTFKAPPPPVERAGGM